MDLEGEGKLTFLQVMGGEESPLENLFRSMDKSSSGSITKEASGVMSVSVICSTSRQSQPVSRDQIYASDILPPSSLCLTLIKLVSSFIDFYIFKLEQGENDSC